MTEEELIKKINDYWTDYASDWQGEASKDFKNYHIDLLLKKLEERNFLIKSFECNCERFVECSEELLYEL